MENIKDMESNLKKLNLAYKAQCEQNWEKSWDNLQVVWSKLEKLIVLVDNQPQIQQILGQNREILPNIVLQNVENSGNDIMITKPETYKNKKIKKKKRNLWSKIETNKLNDALKIFDKKDFKNISIHIGSRTVPQVRSKLQKLDKKMKNK